ncbi:MAG TPA: Xaa-Pro peptidase family protein [Actinomycetota bacterium]
MSADRYAERRARALLAVEEAGLSGLLVTPGPDLVYLTGHDPPPLERLTLLALRPGSAPILLVPGLERPAAEAAPGIAGLRVEGWEDGQDPFELAAAILGGGRFAISDQARASHLLALERAAPAGTGFVAAGEALPPLRVVKDDGEVRALREAGRGADAAFGEVILLAFAGRRERDVAADLDRLLREHGHRSVDFTIVGSGPNGASPHHEAGPRAIEPGDAVVMDFGGVHEGGYCSDITRTVFVGEPSEEHVAVYEVVRRAQQAAFDAVRPGVAAQDVDRAAREVIADAGYGDRFIHRTGHGIGIEVHEPPYIVEGNATLLEPGMTFSDEPGIYLPGRFGVRIEDQVVVTPAGAERLNEASRDLTIVR